MAPVIEILALFTEELAESNTGPLEELIPTPPLADDIVNDPLDELIAIFPLLELNDTPPSPRIEADDAAAVRGPLFD